MRIDGPKTVTETSGKKSVATNQSVGGFNALIKNEATQSGTAARAVNVTSDISSLLAVQEADDSTERQKKRRARARGEALLKHLDNLRLALTLGNVTENHLQTIDSLLQQSREVIEDPDLTAILDDIELRAAVEKAKLEMAKESQI